MKDETISRVYTLADKLLTTAETSQQIIDSEFYFGIWCDDWINRVKDFRKKYWGKEEAPFSADETGDKSFLRWFGGFSKGRNPEALEEWADWLEYRELLKRLAIDYGLSGAAVQVHVQQGKCPPLPTMSLYVYRGEELVTPKEEQAPFIELRLYSAQVTGEDLRTIYNLYRRIHRIHDALYDSEVGKLRKQPSQEPPNLVRTWTVLVLVEKAALSQRQAIREWNDRYPQFSVALAEEGSVVDPGESQISRDVGKLKTRPARILS